MKINAYLKKKNAKKSLQNTYQQYIYNIIVFIQYVSLKFFYKLFYTQVLCSNASFATYMLTYTTYMLPQLKL